MKHQIEPIRKISVTAKPGSSDAVLAAGPISVPAKLGRAGLVPRSEPKREGDGATPQGNFALKTVYYRPDRVAKPETELPVMPIHPGDLWCDDPNHPLYNRPVHAPFTPSHEKMWRDDRCYDIVIVLDYNLVRPVPGQGSAIFFHLTKEDVAPGPTEGCVAIAPHDMIALLPLLSQDAVMEISEV